jgi:Ca-activated chloride channel family protein
VRFWRRPAIAAAAAAVALTLVHARHAVAQTDRAAVVAGLPAVVPAWRTAIELVALQVTVERRDGRPVEGLLPQDFAVFENGVPQVVSAFATAAAPLDLMLLVDVSGSMSERISAARAAIGELLRTLRSDDRAALVLFGDETRVAQPLTHDVLAVERALPSAAGHGGTALFDAVAQALGALAHTRHAPAPIRRQALIVISDGEDTSSAHVSLAGVLAAAGRSGVTIFTITPRTSRYAGLFEMLRRRHIAEAELVMQSLAEVSGGRAFAGLADQALTDAFGRVAAELRCQYWLGYEPNATTAAERHVTVTVVRHPQWRVRTPRGYHTPISPVPAAPAASPPPGWRGRDRSTQ